MTEAVQDDSICIHFSRCSGLTRSRRSVFWSACPSRRLATMLVVLGLRTGGCNSLAAICLQLTDACRNCLVERAGEAKYASMTFE